MAGKSEALQYSKGHLFKAKTLLKPVKCHHDGTFVWAWEKGYKCKECSMIVHKQCIRLVNDSCTAEGALQISGPEEGTLKHMEGVRHDKIGQMVHIDNYEKYKEDPVLQRLFKSAGIDQNHLGPGAMDFAVKFAQEQKLYEFYQAVVPPERREKHRKRLESTAAPPPPPPLPPPPKVSTPKLVVKPKTTADENGENQGAGGEVEDEGEHLTLVEELKRGNVTLRKTSLQPDFERKTVQDTDLHGTLANALAGFRANIEVSSDEDDDYSDEDWADMDRKKKGKSKGAKLGAIEETIEVDKSKENGEELEKFSSPLYQEYMTKIMTNRGCQDEVPSRRFSVKNKIDEIESKSGESSKNGSPANIRASLRQAAPGVEKSEKVESGSETATNEEKKTGNVEKTSEVKTNEENKTACASVATGNVEKTSEVKTSEEESSNVELPNSGTKTEESGRVTEKNEEKSKVSENDKKEENPKSNGDKSRSDLTNNVKKVVDSGGEASKNGSPVNFRASLRPPKGQKVIQ